MRTMLLSFKADVYKKVISGEKIYEHRKVFPNEPVKAYLYVSNPVKSITGVMYLNNRVEIENWKSIYSYDKASLERIGDYLEHHKYAMQITKFEEINAISLNQLRIDVPGFVVPQMYYFIDDSPLKGYLEKHLRFTGKVISHDFIDIKSEQICKS